VCILKHKWGKRLKIINIAGGYGGVKFIIQELLFGSNYYSLND